MACSHFSERARPGRVLSQMFYPRTGGNRVSIVFRLARAVSVCDGPGAKALRLDAGLKRRGITDRLQRWKLGHSNSPAIDVELTAET